MPETRLSVRPAVPEDVPLIWSLINELAVYEKMADDVEGDEPALHRALFGDPVYARALVGEIDGVGSGFALYFFNYSTFLGRPGLYLEDLFVRPDRRGQGLGKALLQHLAREAVAKGCGRMEWVVLDWNQPAIDFYDRLGARQQPEWELTRLDQKGIRDLAGLESEETG
ncbi:MAG: GNAT family N-acetyltransferase [Verrucomicrobiota bacterium]